MKKQTHHIQKQQVILDFTTDESVRYWSHRFSSFYHSEILPAFNSLLDQHIPYNRTYVINRLEIDLGRIHIDEFSAAFLKETETELKRFLKEGAVSGSSIGGSGGVVQNPAGPNHMEDVQQSPVKYARQDENFRIKQPDEHILESFYHFLDYGTLPWNSGFKRIVELEAGIRQEIGLEKLADLPGFQKRMRTTHVRWRFYFQFSGPFVEEIFNRLYKTELAVFLSLQEELQKHLIRLARDVPSREEIKKVLSASKWVWIIADDPGRTRNWPQYLIRSVTETLLPNLKPSNLTSLFKVLFQELSPSSPWTAHLKTLLDSEEIRLKPEKTESTRDQPADGDRNREDSLKTFSGGINETIIDESSRDSLNAPVQRPSVEIQSGGKMSADKVNSDKMSSVDETDAENSPGLRKRRPDERVEDLKKRKLPDTDHPETLKFEELTHFSGFDSEENRQPDFPEVLEEYYLQYAGLILCWPYLARLFNHLQYLDDQTFKDLRCKQRAVHLLGYIGSGEEQPEEHELVLAKFLSAWPLQMPIVKDFELTKKEKNEADQMLSHLITHWPVLKNTSVEGLRQSFFRRDGKLFREEAQWRLLVEQKSYDILLDYLPYTIAIIKLPWMKNILKVDWM